LHTSGNFWPFTPGNEIIFDGKIFVPPFGTAQRAVPDALGPYKLDTGDGYLIHGTHIYNEDSVGDAVSHGCVRMRNDDLAILYQVVPVGTAVAVSHGCVRMRNDDLAILYQVVPVGTAVYIF